MKWLLLALRNTLRNSRRSAVTLAVAALGTAAILLSGGFALFTYQGLEQSAARDTGHLTVARAEQFSGTEDTPLQHGIENYAALRRTLLKERDVRYVLPRLSFSGLLSNGDKSVVMLGLGIDPQAEFKVRGPFLSLVEGTELTLTESPQVMLGEDLARSLNVHPGAGLTVLAATADGALNAIDVQVQGIFNTGVPEVDKRLLYTDVATAQQLLGLARVSSLGVYLSDISKTAVMRQQLRRLLAPNLDIRTWREQAVFYLSVRSLYNRIFGALGVIIIVIVLFVVANAMAMAIVERTREIGTLRALGTLPGQLERVFALEGALLGGGGAAVGSVLAVTASWLLLFADVQMPPPPGRSVGYPLQISMSPLLYLTTFITVTVLSLTCAALIGRRTAAKPIVEALAHA